jgi:hypothetical protein
VDQSAVPHAALVSLTLDVSLAPLMGGVCRCGRSAYQVAESESFVRLLAHNFAFTGRRTRRTRRTRSTYCCTRWAPRTPGAPLRASSRAPSSACASAGPTCSSRWSRGSSWSSR